MKDQGKEVFNHFIILIISPWWKLESWDAYKLGIDFK